MITIKLTKKQIEVILFAFDDLERAYTDAQVEIPEDIKDAIKAIEDQIYDQKFNEDIANMLINQSSSTKQ